VTPVQAPAWRGARNHGAAREGNDQMVQLETGAATRQRTLPAIIDCDVHNEMDSEKDLYPYLSTRWLEHLKTFGMRGYSGSNYPRFVNRLVGTNPPSGRAAGSDSSFARVHLLDTWNIHYAILNPLTGVGRQLNPYFDAALASAVNDWQVADWLDQDARYRASMIIPFEYPELAVAEIERRASDKRFVQVQFSGRPREPMGRFKYWPIYEACEKHGLAVMSHAFGSGGQPITGAGWPSFYIEDHVGPAQSIQANIISMVVEGVFERFPGLKLVSVENGLAWAASLMWRLDSTYHQLKSEVPHLKRLPSEYVRAHCYFSTQPMEEPPHPQDFLAMLEQIGAPDNIMFATDYPHWDWDAPDQAFPVKLPDDVKRRICYENALALYRLPDSRG
jgi:predicted TIM-barrel fold metal-dependent hydrolase